MQSYSTKMAPIWWPLAVAGLACTLVIGSTLAVAAQGKTEKASVFSAPQAKRGEGLYQNQCSSCHSADLSGGGAPELAGADFLSGWDKSPVADLVSKIETSMPASSPG